MNHHHLAIRASLSTMSPNRAIEYIHAFHLPEEEELFLIECDVRRKSQADAAEKYHTSTSVVNRRRQRAFSKMVDHIKHYGNPADQ